MAILVRNTPLQQILGGPNIPVRMHNLQGMALDITALQNIADSGDPQPLITTDTTQSTSTTTGSGQFAGGVGIAKDLFVGGQVHSLVPVTIASAATLAPAATAGSTIVTLAAAAVTVTLPACAAASVGLSYEFVTTTIATAQIINTTGSDVFLGSVYSTLAVVNATNDTACGSSTANKTMTMNGTTTGGLPGSRIRVTCISATQWLVSGFVIGASGTQATLFSN